MNRRSRSPAGSHEVDELIEFRDRPHEGKHGRGSAHSVRDAPLPVHFTALIRPTAGLTLKRHDIGSFERSGLASLLRMAGSGVVADHLDLVSWLRQQCADYAFGAGGVFLRDSDRAAWPLIAHDPAELEARLSDGGHLLPLPKEPAALANVLEVSILNFLEARIAQVPEAAIQRGTERGYPDLEISGTVFGGGHHAIDVKAARRARNLTQTQSRITLYTGNTYFRWPDLHWPGTFRPFNEYASHLDLILVYTLNEASNARVEDLEVIVQEPWRIASRERSSTTREYIGAVTSIAALREGRGAFEAPAAFYDYWRRFPFKVSPQVQNQLQRLLASAQQELAVLRRQRQPGDE